MSTEKLSITVSNEYLGVEEVIGGASSVEIRIKAATRLARWEALEMRQREKAGLDNLKEQAEYDTLQAERLIKECKNIMLAHLNTGKGLDWASLYEDRPYPPFVYKEAPPRYGRIAKEMGVPRRSRLAEIFSPSAKKRRSSLEEEARQAFDTLMNQHREGMESARVTHEEQRTAFIKEQSEYNRSVEQLQLDFEKGFSSAVESAVRIALTGIACPGAIVVEYNARFDPAEKLIVVNCVFPRPVDLPQIAHYRYNEQEHGIEAEEMSRKDFEQLYESVLIQIALCAIYTVFRVAPERYARQICLNGWVKDRDSGNKGVKKSCILTCKVTREVFESLDLAGTPYVVCFQTIKGVKAEPLAGLAPVRPFINLEWAPFPDPEDGLSKAASGAEPGAPTYQPGDFKREAKEIVAGLLDQIENDLKTITGDGEKNVIH